LNTFFFHSIYFSQLNKLSLNWAVQSIGPRHPTPSFATTVPMDSGSRNRPRKNALNPVVAKY
jgi:hypothetical protein